MDDFLKDLKSRCRLVSEYEDYGWAGSGLSGHLEIDNLDEILKHYPKISKDNLRRACMIVLKDLMKEERTRIFKAKYLG